MSGKKINKKIIKSYGAELEQWLKEEKDIDVFFKKVLEGLSANELTLEYKKELEQKIETFKYRLNKTIEAWEKMGIFKMTKKEYNVYFWERNRNIKNKYKELLKKFYDQDTGGKERLKCRKQIIAILEHSKLGLKRIKHLYKENNLHRDQSKRTNDVQE